MVPFPNFPAHISMTNVDYVVAVDEIGDPNKIATGAAKPTTDMRKLMMADYCTQFVINTPYFKDGFSYQTGVGGASIASTISLAKVMKERGARMRFGVGGLTKPMCQLLIDGQVDALLDTQDFDLAAVESVKDLHHFRISAGEYANPFNKGAVVNKLDFVILAALEVDVNFNCNVVVDSNGMITGAQGGHPDTAAGAKCAIVIAPLLQGRTPAICTDVTTVTTPGESVDVVITDYGIAINPRRKDLIEAMLPVYKKLKIRPTTLLLICVTSMGVMNLLPWGGPTMRAATFLGIGLADVEIKDHIKNCFFWIWGVSIVCLLAGLLLGVIKI